MIRNHSILKLERPLVLFPHLTPICFSFAFSFAIVGFCFFGSCLGVGGWAFFFLCVFFFSFGGFWGGGGGG